MQPQHTTTTPQKQCSKCKEFKPATVEFFQADKRLKSGLASQCKACVSAYKQEWAEANADHLATKRREHYEANKDEILAQQAEFRKANPELIRERKKADYERHKEAYIERAAKYQRENKDKLNEQARERWAENRDKFNARKKERNKERGEEARDVKRKWKAANRDRINEQARESYAEDPERIKQRNGRWRAKNLDKQREATRKYRKENPEKMRLWGRINVQNRAARKAGLPDTLTWDDWYKCLDYFDGCCAACGRSTGEGYTIAMDHWIPLSSPDCPGTIPTNIVPLCHGLGGCNNSKKNNDPVEWAIKKFGEGKGRELVTKVLAYFVDI